MAIDIERVRTETPGCRDVIHFNNAGAALMPQPVVAAQVSHLELEARIGGYEAAERAGNKLRRTYLAAARLLGCSPAEIALVESATAAWEAVFYGIKFGTGDRILTSQVEYASNYIAYLHVARNTGARVEAIPSDRHGQVSLDALAAMLDRNVKLVSITHVPTNGGLVNPAEAIGRLTRDSSALYLLDACQSVGQMPIDVERIGCDFLSATGRKYLRGPRGSGFLYVRSSALERIEPPRLDLHSASWVAPDRYRPSPAAQRFERWERNWAATIGLGAAIDYARDLGLDAIESRVVHLAEMLRDRLRALPGVEVLDLGSRRCGIVSFRVRGQHAGSIKEALRARRINVSIATRSSTLLDMTDRGLQELIRASVHYYNTEQELEALCEFVAGR
ncbi:MAG: aminotransferase class V-fold PLP-dependent enzyme [Proteobacteria bacterium]|nr:aminotransferase class V-fold PLP-dependent enzyme [Pseudomonadota bacterium]